MRKQVSYPLSTMRESQYDAQRARLLEGDGAAYRLACKLHDLCVPTQFAGDEPAPLYTELAYTLLVDTAARRQIAALLRAIDETTIPRRSV